MHLADSREQYLIETLADLVKSARARNEDGYHNYEIAAAEEAIKKAKGLPYDGFYFGEAC